MPEAGTETYASFAATHEDRLVRSLVSESGLSPAAAARAAADVLPAGYDRAFPTCGAAYGWLRVAARHRAAGSGDWAHAADTAVCQAAAARAALAGLPAEDRELLRLHYADGLLPAALADRLGVPVEDVLARLDRAVAATRAAGDAGAAASAAALAAPADDATGTRRRSPLPRLAAAAAVVAGALLLGNGVTPPPTQPPVATSPLPGFAGGTTITPVAGEAPVAASESGRAPDVTARAAGTRTARVTALPPAARPPGTKAPERCRRRCHRLFDEIRVPVPKQVADATGQREVVVVQEHGSEYVHVCDVVSPVPADVARCSRGEP